jgi:hypothetical protein
MASAVPVECVLCGELNECFRCFLYAIREEACGVRIEGEERAGDDEIHVNVFVQDLGDDDVVYVVFGRVEAGGRRSVVDMAEDSLELCIEFTHSG